MMMMNNSRIKVKDKKKFSLIMETKHLTTNEKELLISLK